MMTNSLAEMTGASIGALPDRELLRRLVRVADDERHLTADLLALLGECDVRRLYLGAGCSSLFTYCTQVLHFSEHTAYHRIEAARASRQFPIVLEMVADGSVTLTTVALLRPHLTWDNHRQLLTAARHRTKREVEYQIACLAPRPDARTVIRRLPAYTRAQARAVAKAAVSLPSSLTAHVGPGIPTPGAACTSVSAAAIPLPTPLPTPVPTPALSPVRAHALISGPTLDAAPIPVRVPAPTLDPASAHMPVPSPTLDPVAAHVPGPTPTLDRAPAHVPVPATTLNPAPAHVPVPAPTLDPAPAPATAHDLSRSPTASPTTAATPNTTATPTATASNLAADAAPALADPQSKITPLAADRYLLRITISAETHAKLRRAQQLMGRRVLDGDPHAIIGRALSLLVEHLERAKFARVRRPRAGSTGTAESHSISASLGSASAESASAESASANGSRYVPAAMRRHVWVRDEGRCAFVGTHGRCAETRHLEFHHVVPFARGGPTRIENLALRCRAHNAYESEQAFGARLPEGSGSGRKCGSDPRDEAQAAQEAQAVKEAQVVQEAQAVDWHHRQGSGTDFAQESCSVRTEHDSCAARTATRRRRRRSAVTK